MHAQLSRMHATPAPTPAPAPSHTSQPPASWTMLAAVRPGAFFSAGTCSTAQSASAGLLEARATALALASESSSAVACMTEGGLRPACSAEKVLTCRMRVTSASSRSFCGFHVASTSSCEVSPALPLLCEARARVNMAVRSDASAPGAHDSAASASTSAQPPRLDRRAAAPPRPPLPPPRCAPSVSGGSQQGPKIHLYRDLRVPPCSASRAARALSTGLRPARSHTRRTRAPPTPLGSHAPAAPGRSLARHRRSPANRLDESWWGSCTRAGAGAGDAASPRRAAAPPPPPPSHGQSTASAGAAAVPWSPSRARRSAPGRALPDRAMGTNSLQSQFVVFPPAQEPRGRAGLGGRCWGALWADGGG